MDYPLPSDTQQNFLKVNEKCSNLSLLLDRYIPCKYNSSKKEWDSKNKWEFEGKDKNNFLTSIVKDFNFSFDLINSHYQRWQKRIQYYQNFSYCQDFTASPEWRVIVGLGQASILETSITLDRITGIPIIPGSALKGLAASYALLCVLEKTNRLDEVEKEYQKYLKKEIDEVPDNYLKFIKMFGYEGQAGGVVFLDAVPTTVPTLEPDIMNNHYPDYYGDKNGTIAPTPYQKPNPVYFLTLGKKSQFAFAVASRTLDKDSQDLVDHACKWLKAGLSELGIGAKTAAGYGYLI
jgi:CRISPR-associated protein Cmr6